MFLSKCVQREFFFEKSFGTHLRFYSRKIHILVVNIFLMLLCLINKTSKAL